MVETNLQAVAKLLSQLHVVTQDASLQATLVDVTLMFIEDSLVGLSNKLPSLENCAAVQVALSLTVHLHVTSARHASALRLSDCQKCIPNTLLLPSMFWKYLNATGLFCSRQQ